MWILIIFTILVIYTDNNNDNSKANTNTMINTMVVALS